MNPLRAACRVRNRFSLWSPVRTNHYILDVYLRNMGYKCFLDVFLKDAAFS